MTRTTWSGGTTPSRLDLLRLKFSDPEFEQAFQDEYCHSTLSVVRIALVLGILLVSAFAVLDVWIAESHLRELYFIRFLIICPTLLALYGLTYVNSFRRHLQTGSAAAMLIVGLGITAMTGIIDKPGSYLYYGGILDTIIYCCCVMRLRFLDAVAVALALLAAYLVTALFLNPIPEWALLNNTFFLTTALGVGTFSAYVQEFYLRRAYVNHQLLAREKHRSEELLAEAVAASKAKSEFLAMVSHELRTPLNAIIGFSELMKREMFGPLGEDRYLAYSEDIHQSGAHLLEIINNMLDISKAEAGRLEIKEDVVDVEAAVGNVLRLIRDNARQRRIELSYDIGRPIPRLCSDQNMVTRIALNLISNAIKFCEQGGRVSVSLDLARNGDLLLVVSDTGIGIAYEDIPKVLEAFVQVDNSMTRSHEGTGLGLPLSKKMLELHGGALELESAVGVGTTVRARFPANRLTKAPSSAPIGHGRTAAAG